MMSLPAPASRSQGGLPASRSGGWPLAALGIACCAAALGVAGVLAGVVEGARPGYSGRALLGVLTALPAVLALVLVLRAKTAIALGVLIGAGVVAAGRVAMDAQFAIDVTLTARPEFHVVDALAAPAPAPGLWLLLCGHGLAAVAAMVALRAAGSVPDEAGALDEPKRLLLLLAMLSSLAVSLGLVLAPFRSDNAYVVGTGALDAPLPVLSGALALALAVPVTAALGVTARSLELARGVLLGLGVGVAGLALPAVAGAVIVPWLHIAPGAVLMAIAAVAFVLLAVIAPAPRPTHASAGPGVSVVTSRQVRTAHTVTGLLALLAGGCALAGASAPMLLSRLDGAEITSPSAGLLVPAGALFAVLGIGMFVPSWAGVLRAMVMVSWAGVFLAATAALATPAAAADLPDVSSPGSGVAWAVAAISAAVLACVAGVVAGQLEREWLGVGTVVRPGKLPRGLAIAAAVLAAGAFVVPVIAAPDYLGSGLWQYTGTAFWGLLAAAAVVVIALVTAHRCRRAQATAMMVGAAGVVALRALELPVAGRYIAESQPGIGVWFAVASFVTIALAVVANTASKQDNTHR